MSSFNHICSKKKKKNAPVSSTSTKAALELLHLPGPRRFILRVGYFHRMNKTKTNYWWEDNYKCYKTSANVNAVLIMYLTNSARKTKPDNDKPWSHIFISVRYLMLL